MTLLISFHTSCTILNAKVELSDDQYLLKGTDHDFFLVKNTHESFAQAIQNTYNQKKQQNPHKIAEIMRKTGLCTFHCLSSVFFFIS